MPRIDNRGNLRGSASAAGGVGVASNAAQEFYRVSKILKSAGEGDLRKQFHKAVGAAAKPLLPKVRESARETAPKHGGLNERLAKKPYRVQTRTGASTAGVRIVGSKVDPRMNAAGRIAHPVFGRKGKAANGGKNTVVQTVDSLKGYFDKPLQESGPEVQKAVVDAMTDFTRKILRGEVG